MGGILVGRITIIPQRIGVVSINFKLTETDFQLGEVHEKLIVLDKHVFREELVASFLPINYIYYNYYFQDDIE